MYNAFLERTVGIVQALKQYIITSEQFRTAAFEGLVEADGTRVPMDSRIASNDTIPDKLQWRVIDHCTVVTRLYAIYEQFVHEMVREHLILLQERIPYISLPTEIQSAYRNGVSKILEKKDGPRFGDINLEQLVSGYHNALTGLPYSLEPRAMLMQEQNLRLLELHRFLKAGGIDGVESWIERHRAIMKFFAEEDRITATAASQLSELIKYRNDAAHGSIDLSSILHFNVLLELCDFVIALCEALSEKVLVSGLQILKEHHYASEAGKVTECLRQGSVVICRIVGEVQTGGTLYLSGETHCVERKILEIQLEGVSVDKFNGDGTKEIGLLLDSPAKKGMNIVIVKLLSRLDSVVDAIDIEAGKFGTELGDNGEHIGIEKLDMAAANFMDIENVLGRSNPVDY